MSDPPAQSVTVAVATVDPESERLLASLRGPRRDAAVAELHDRLRRIARAEVSRRGGRIPFSGPELDDVVTTAADDATLAVLAKLDDFRGESRFTTWAAKFAILEVSNKVGRNLWRTRGVHLDPDAWDQMPDRFEINRGIGQRQLDLAGAVQGRGNQDDPIPGPL